MYCMHDSVYIVKMKSCVSMNDLASHVWKNACLLGSLHFALCRQKFTKFPPSGQASTKSLITHNAKYLVTAVSNDK